LCIQENLSDMKENNTITIDFQKIFIETKPKITGKSGLLINANEKYNTLVSKGLIKKRGYTLRGIEDTHLFYTQFNGL
jgi:hypothetical protein